MKGFPAKKENRFAKISHFFAFRSSTKNVKIFAQYFAFSAIRLPAKKMLNFHKKGNKKISRKNEKKICNKLPEKKHENFAKRIILWPFQSVLSTNVATNNRTPKCSILKLY